MPLPQITPEVVIGEELQTSPNLQVQLRQHPGGTAVQSADLSMRGSQNVVGIKQYGEVKLRMPGGRPIDENDSVERGSVAAKIQIK